MSPSSTSPVLVVAGVEAEDGGQLDLDEASDQLEYRPRPGKTKAKTRRRGSNAFGSSPIQMLPVECLVHVFAHLLPIDLGMSQLVCRNWHDVVADETSWRRAFEVYYGVADPRHALARRVVEPKSVSTTSTLSWRGEYIARVALTRQWHRSKTSTVTSNPSLGALSSIHVQQQQHPSTAAVPSSSSSSPASELALLSVSLPLGAAVHSLPFTGKLSKRPLVVNPLDHVGRPLVPNLAVANPTSYSVGGGGDRLVWGMADGTIRVQNAHTTLGGGARGTAGSAIDQGLVRVVEEAHRFGTEVQLVSFSNLGGPGGAKTSVKQRMGVFASVGRDGFVNIWTLSVPPPTGGGEGGDARERSPVAAKLWSAKWERTVGPAQATAPAASGVLRRTRATAIAFDAGWIGRHNGRQAKLAIGTSQGQVIVWPGFDLSDTPDPQARGEEPIIIEHEAGVAIETLVFDPNTSLLVHSSGSNEFSKYDLPSTSAPLCRTIFRHTYLGDPITSIAVDFDEPPPSPVPVVAASSGPGTPGDATPPSISLVPPHLISLDSCSTTPPLSRTNSGATATTTLKGRNQVFGTKPFVVTGDDHGRVHVWDWSAASPSQAAGREEGGRDRDGVVCIGPSKLVQDSESTVGVAGGGGGGGGGGGEGGSGSTSSKVTALELTRLGVFVGSLDGTVRLYSLLGPTPSTVIRTFKQRTANRHASRLLGQGLIPDDEEERWHVSQIRAGRDWVVASVGGKVLAWRTKDALGNAKKSNGGTGPGAKGKLTPRQERFRANMELQHQVKESMSQLSNESSARYRQYQQDQRLSRQFGLPPSLDNLTEEEAVAFAIMLSHEDHQERDDGWEQPPQEWLADDGVVLDEDYDYDDPAGRYGRRSSSSHSTSFDDVRDDDDDGWDGHVARGRPSLSTSLTVPSSPFSSHSWKPASATASSSPSLSTSFGSPPSRLQVSPRLGPVYGSQNQFSNDPVPDMDPLLWPTAVASSSTSTSPPNRSSPSYPYSRSPAPSPSPVATRSGTNTPNRRGWSAVVAASVPGLPSRSPMPHASRPASTPASYRPPSSPTPSSSLLSNQLRRTAQGPTTGLDNDDAASSSRDRERREAEDLAFALEMSLVEQVSRIEI